MSAPVNCECVYGGFGADMEPEHVLGKAPRLPRLDSINADNAVLGSTAISSFGNRSTGTYDCLLFYLF